MGSRYWNQVPAAERLVMRTPEWGNECDERCWEMTGEGPKGYPYIGVDGQRWLAHRFAYMIHVGDPDGLLVLHLCDNPRCVRPSHLFAGTHADNTADMMHKGRNVSPRRETCNQGHPITDVGPRGGRRRCRVCHAESARRQGRGLSSVPSI